MQVVLESERIIRYQHLGRKVFAADARSFFKNFYEHQKPLASVAELIGLHLPGPGLPVVPHSRQI